MPIASATVPLLVVAVVGMTVLVLLQGFVLVEMVRQVSQIRQRLNLDDRPFALSLAGHVGQPVPERLLAADPLLASRDALTVLLSTDCATCRTVAAGMAQFVRELSPELRVVAVVDGRTEREVTEFMSDTHLAAVTSVTDDGALGARLGVTVRPVAVVSRRGRIEEAAVVRNTRQLGALAAQVLETRSGDAESRSDGSDAQPSLRGELQRVET